MGATGARTAHRGHGKSGGAAAVGRPGRSPDATAVAFTTRTLFLATKEETPSVNLLCGSPKKDHQPNIHTSTYMACGRENHKNLMC